MKRGEENREKGETRPRAKQDVKSARPRQLPVEQLENCTFLNLELVFYEKSNAYPKLKMQMNRFVAALNSDEPLPRGLRSAITTGPKRAPASWRNVETLLANLYHMKAKRKSTVAVSLSPNAYSNSTVNSGMINLIKLAAHHNLIVLDKGFRNPTEPRKSRKSRIKPTAKLNRLLKADLSEPQIIDAIVAVPDELIKLKRTNRETSVYWNNERLYSGIIKTKEPVPRKEWEKTLTQGKKEELKSLEHAIESFNSLLEEYTITYLAQEDNLRHTLHPALFCSYNDNFERGGRFYTGVGGHTNLSKKERDTIMFDGQPTVELDYGGMHVRMLYHLAGGEYPWDGDPYKDVLREMGKDYDGLQRKFGEDFAKAIRNDLKVMLLTLVGDEIGENIKNPLGNAAKKINHNLFNKWTVKKDPEKQENEKAKNLECKARWDKAGLLNKSGSTLKVVKSFVEAHEPINEYFQKGVAVELQNIDAKIARKVMGALMLTDKDKCVPVLPVHDSFIVFRQERHSQRLRAAMGEAYREVLQQVTGTNTEFKIPVRPLAEHHSKNRLRA